MRKLHELLTGRLPHDLGERGTGMAGSIVRGRAPAPVCPIGEPPGTAIERIVERALEKDRSRRYPSAAELAEDVRRVLEGRLAATGTPCAAPSVRPPGRRNALTLLLLALRSLVHWLRRHVSRTPAVA